MKERWTWDNGVNLSRFGVKEDMIEVNGAR